MKIITNFNVLMRLASDLGRAEKLGVQEDIEKAQKAHDSYRDICLKADQMSLGCKYGDLL